MDQYCKHGQNSERYWTVNLARTMSWHSVGYRRHLIASMDSPQPGEQKSEESNPLAISVCLLPLPCVLFYLSGVFPPSSSPHCHAKVRKCMLLLFPIWVNSHLSGEKSCLTFSLSEVNRLKRSLTDIDILSSRSPERMGRPVRCMNCSLTARRREGRKHSKRVPCTVMVTGFKYCWS